MNDSPKLKPEQVIERLRDTHLFTPGDGGIWSKQELFLTWMRVKPVTNTFSNKYSDPKNYLIDRGDNPLEVEDFLGSIDLVSKIWQAKGTYLLVSRAKSLLDAAVNAGDQRNYYLVSALYGYPTSANYWRPGAPLKDEHLEDDEQYELSKDHLPAEYTGTLPGFRLSKANWREEVKVLQDWYGVLERYS